MESLDQAGHLAVLVGGWHYIQPPLPGELLTSCLARNALAHGMSPYRFLALFWQREPVWERDFDRNPEGLLRTDRRPDAPDWLDDLARHMKLARPVLENATLAGYRARLAGPRLLGGDTPLVLSAGVYHRIRTRHALQFCRSCLVEGRPCFRKIWRLGFVVACERHDANLQDGCPHCGAPIVPHRSTTNRITDCHRCGRSIVEKGHKDGQTDGDKTALELQRKLVTLLDGDATGDMGLWRGREVFDIVRTLLAVSTPGTVHAQLRGAFGLGKMVLPGDRMRFEHARLAVRLPWLEMVGIWTADWPRSFRDGADAAGLTQRTFRRRHLSPVLAAEVARLPLGIERDRSWIPVLEEPTLNRLRRRDPSAYRTERARRIMAVTGRP